MYKITHTNNLIHWVNGPDKIGAINTFLPPEDCGNVLANNAIYEMVGSACVLRANADDILVVQEQLAADKVQRVSEIVAEQDLAGTRKLTVEDIDNYLDAQYNPAAFDAAGLAIHQLSDADLSPAARAAIVVFAQEIRKMFINSKAVDRRIAIEILK